jgi:hypothetical protein
MKFVGDGADGEKSSQWVVLISQTQDSKIIFMAPRVLLTWLSLVCYEIPTNQKGDILYVAFYLGLYGVHEVSADPKDLSVYFFLVELAAKEERASDTYKRWFHLFCPGAHHYLHCYIIIILIVW